jgi:hypothetical protein
MAAAAMAPLMIGYQVAHAQNPTLTISGNTSTPVATATAVSGGPGDIVINTGVTFTVNNTTPAVTLNSNNNVTSSGTITSNNIDNATGILVQGPFSGVVGNAGTISLGESYTPSDSANNDGIAEAPFAQGTGRIGINVTGPLTGQISDSGTIQIQGNNSTGILIGGVLTGTGTVSGSTISTPNALSTLASTITIAGNNNYGVRSTAEIKGNVALGGSISMKGQGSVGASFAGPIDNQLLVYSTISTTGYAITTREAGQILTNIQKTPADVQQGGSALQIQGSVQGGVFLAAPPGGTVTTDTTTDADGDGIPDSAESTSSLTTYGSAPTIQIGGPAAINIGNFGNSTSTIDNTYGLILEGTVTSAGIWDGVSSNAVDIGVGGHGVNLNGGIRISGAITATAYQADATVFHLESGVTGAGLFNAGAVNATVTSSSLHTATAIQIDAGATIGSLTNYGSIIATVNGDTSNANAVIDKGGGIASVTNYGTITTNLNPALPDETVTGKGVALDLSANTTGVTLTQLQDANNPLVTPAIKGDVYLGSGPNNVSLLAGSIRGALSLSPALAAGQSASSIAPASFVIDNAANYTGALTYAGTRLALDVKNGVLNDTSPTPLGLTTLHVGGASTLGVALDPTHNTYTQFNVSGAATFDAGAKITATLLSAPPLAGQTFTIVKAGTLSVGASDSALLPNLPYLFNGSLHSDPTANTISLTIATKTPAQMGFNKAETAAFNAIYTALPQDSGIQTAVLSAPDHGTLVSTYDQLLPSSSGDVFNTVLGVSKAVSRATSDRFDTATQSDDEDEGDFIVSGFWASEFFSGLEQNKADNNAYHSAALGVIGGYDFGGTGFTIAAGSSNITKPHQPGDTLNAVSFFEGGFYAAPRFGALTIDARVAGGYMRASDRRQFAASIVSGDQSTTSYITRTAKGAWSGYDFSGHLGAGLDLYASKHLFFQPKVYADVFHLHENAYNEHSDTPGYGPGYVYNVSQRDSTQTNATASIVTGLKFGNTFVFSPQVEIGYDKVLTGGPGATTARFAYGGPTMVVPANQIDGAAVGRLSLRGDGNYVHFSLQAGGEYTSSYHSLDMKAVFRLTF